MCLAKTKKHQKKPYVKQFIGQGPTRCALKQQRHRYKNATKQCGSQSKTPQKTHVLSCTDNKHDLHKGHWPGSDTMCLEAAATSLQKCDEAMRVTKQKPQTIHVLSCTDNEHDLHKGHWPGSDATCQRQQQQHRYARSAIIKSPQWGTAA